MHRALAAALVLAALPASAEEGMWTFDAFPTERARKELGFAPDAAWLEHVRLSSVRLAGGCSGSFVSPDGLVLTNHHCVRGGVQDLSTPREDLVAKGFLARRRDQERRLSRFEINVLTSIADVTARVRAATQGKAGKELAAARKAAITGIEKECATSAGVRCDVVSLYQGARYALYRYERHQDVRLVFAPEAQVGFFGGDPDNFNFPRYNLDMALLRVYRDGAPLKTPHHLPWSAEGVKEGDATFVSGHPWSTSRLLTRAQLELLRDVAQPMSLFWLSELRGALTVYGLRSAEAERQANSLLKGVENGIKARKGRFEALLSAELAERNARELEAMRARLTGAARKELEEAVALVARKQRELRGFFAELSFLEGLGGRAPMGFSGDLFAHARTLVRASDELKKPDQERLRELADANLPAIRQRLTAAAPVHADLEVELLAFSLTKLREALGADHPAVRAALGRDTPREVATRAVRGTKLGQAAVRAKLLESGVDGSKDPMIDLARRVDALARAARERFETEVEAPVTAAAETIAAARFAAFGTSAYPDATASLRISWGRVKGWTEPGGARVTPFTTLGGAFDHATGKPPYDLPASWTAAREKLALDTPLNLATTNDIIGGNSGSPVIDRQGRLVGLIFDGNIHSLAGDYYFDPALNRAVAVDARGMMEALRVIYRADALVAELQGGAAQGGSPAKASAP